MDERRIINEDFFPLHTCNKCGGKLKYKGIGEYCCEDCKEVEYDDYGKVRNYLEEHHGANVAEVSEATGVAKGKIRELLREERIEVAPNSTIFLRCEACGTNILSGHFCTSCVAKMSKAELDAKTMIAVKQKNVQGYGKAQAESGEKRFHR